MKNITVSPGITIRKAMRVLNKTAEKCLLVVDENKKLLGTLTDGDLRRSILRGMKFTEDITSSYNTRPRILFKDKFKDGDAKQLLHENQLDLIPVVDENRVVMDYVTWYKIGGDISFKKILANVPVVIMAGGKGTRLEPFTKILPKPLVPVHEKPIIEHIIERFTDLGCNDFYMTVSYKVRILKAYFEELQPNYEINFIEEQKPMGTAGSLRFLEGQFSNPFFVTNCDIIIKTDYARLYEFHQKGGFDVTLVASLKEYVIPYGTCELNGGGYLSRINEKPHYDFLINTGLYVLNPEIIKLIPKNKFYHITYLIEEVKNQGKKVGVYPIDDDAWIDVGEWAEYRQAIERL